MIIKNYKKKIIKKMKMINLRWNNMVSGEYIIIIIQSLLNNHNLYQIIMLVYFNHYFMVLFKPSLLFS